MKSKPTFGLVCQRMCDGMADAYTDPRCPEILADEIFEFQARIFNLVNGFSGPAGARRNDALLRGLLPMLCEMTRDGETTKALDTAEVTENEEWSLDPDDHAKGD